MAPPLTERDSNITMAPKRKRVEVDLTGDSDTESNKAPRHVSSNVHGGSYRSVYGGSTHDPAERSDWLADDVDDINEIVGSSQNGAEESDVLHAYGDMASKIVGVQ